MSIKKIAELSGYSTATVSRVLNHIGNVSDEAQKAVLKAAQEIGYTRNASGYALRVGIQPASSVVRLGMILSQNRAAIGNEFYVQIEKSVRVCAARRSAVVGKTLLMSSVLKNPALIEPYDGIVVIGRCPSAALKTLRSYIRHIVCTGLNPYDDSCDQVLCNGEEIAHQVVQFLLQRGYRTIGYTGEVVGDVRYRGYCRAMHDFKLRVDESYLFDVPETREGGTRAAKLYLALKTPPAAVFCANDVSAIGFISVLNLAKVPRHRMPAIMSIDDTGEGARLSPMLSSIHIPLMELGDIATRTLLDRISGGHTIPLRIELPYQIINRETVI